MINTILQGEMQWQNPFYKSENKAAANGQYGTEDINIQ